MKSLKLTSIAIASGLVLTGCATVPHVDKTPKPTPIAGITIVDVTDSYNFNKSPQFENYIEYVDEHDVIAVVGGSGSCPPKPIDVKFENSKVTINAEEYAGMACTMDYRMYAYEIKTSADSFKDKPVAFCYNVNACSVLAVYSKEDLDALVNSNT